jgi:iron(III) transport system substrate-binding protein
MHEEQSFEVGGLRLEVRRKSSERRRTSNLQPPTYNLFVLLRLFVPSWLLIALALGCGRNNEKQDVVLYSSVDEPYVSPLLKKFEAQTGIHVRLLTDTEATKSAALSERIEAEKDHPQADVYWGNEIFHTINLAERGVFAAYRPTTAEDVPSKWRAKDNLYTGIGLRARMIAFTTTSKLPALHGLNDLTQPALKGRIGICHPGFGTASGHIAALYVLWGEPKFTDYMRALRANDIKLLGGNSAVVDQIAAGNLLAGISDNDDINNAKTEGQAVDGILPDQDGPGTLLIPTTIALVNHVPHPAEAKRLIDFLCTRDVEKQLIDSRFLVASVRDQGSIKSMDIDYVQASHQMRHAIEVSLNILQDRQK